MGGLIEKFWQASSAERSGLLDKLLAFKLIIPFSQGQGHVLSMKNIGHRHRVEETVHWEVLSPKMRWELGEIISCK